jgi:eukaryotic-like serine/threonine-protein kinase
MNERAIFDAVSEIPDPDRRREYLDKFCGGDAVLRARIEALLYSHQSASQFLDVPAIEQFKPIADRVGGSDATRTHAGDPRVPRHQDDDSDGELAVVPDLSFLSRSSKPDSIGTLGHYEILQVLGQGAFGIVLRAFDEKLHRVVAIKVLNPQMAATSPPRKRFLREARSAAAIRHENIVQVYSVEDQPLPYLVMEYIDGQTLQQKLDGTGPLDVREILTIARQLALGLAAAHEKGLIHRDIKPGNILLERGVEQRVKITDFGLARAADDASLTRTGLISGTPMYMAPEQANGESLDHRTDLFSLGSVLYVMASGRPPFRADKPVAILKRVMEETPRPIQQIIPEVPDWLCEIIAKLHSKKREDRFQSAQEVADLLGRREDLLTTPNVAQNIDRSSGFMWGVFGAFSAIALMICVAFLTTGNSSPKEATSAGNSTPMDLKKQSHPDGSPEEKFGDPVVVPAPAIAPFDEQQATKHRDEWAKYLKLPVEFTNSVGMIFRLIPPGEFTMGMTREDAESVAKLIPNNDYWKTMALSSAPQHRVRLTQAWYMGIHEVTQEQYKKIMDRSPSYYAHGSSGRDVVRGKNTMTHPVERVSLVDAVEFCIKLSERENLQPVYLRTGESFSRRDGNGYRLPTEAEWEWGCRAGTTSPWFHGSRHGRLKSTAWFLENSGAMTHPVGLLQSNPFGLFDMHGNVWEWCQDWYDSNAYSQQIGTTSTNPAGPPTGTTGVLRGGSRYCIPEHCHSALRAAEGIQARHQHHGFRVVAEIGIANAGQ